MNILPVVYGMRSIGFDVNTFPSLHCKINRFFFQREESGNNIRIQNNFKFN